MDDHVLHALRRGGPQPWESPQVVLGTVGWEDVDTFVELGTGDNDGFTLVRVQLYMGGEQARPRKVGVAQGRKILCHISSLIGFRVPARGTRVLVTIPYGLFSTPGAGVITGTIERVPITDYSENKVRIDFGATTDLVISAKSVKIYESTAGASFIGVGVSPGYVSMGLRSGVVPVPGLKGPTASPPPQATSILVIE